MTKRAAVTGLGAVSSCGLGVAALWQGLLAGVQRLRPRPALASVGFAEMPLGLVPLPEDPDEDGGALLSGAPRALAMASRAADEALADAGWPAGSGSSVRLGLSIGTTLGEKAPFIVGLRGSASWRGASHGCAAPARWLAERLGAQRVRVVSAACASGNAALGVALGWIRAGLCDAVLCGGVDALQEFVLSGFVSLRAHSLSPCRPFDAHRCGLNLGEGAGFLLIESEAHASARGQTARAYLDGSGQACDAHHMTGPDREGRGASRAMLAALTDAGLSPAEVDFVSAHGTATVFNDLMEARALESVFGGRCGSVPVNSIKGAIGHSLGAAGALEAIMAVRVLEEQLIPPTAGHAQLDRDIRLDVVAGAARSWKVRSVLSTSSGFGGLNAALLFTAAARGRGGAA